MTPWPIVMTAGACGAVMASFATTWAMRDSLANAPAGSRSACDGCRRPLGWLETTPIVSFIALRGRCRTCDGPISRLHPIGEVVGLAAMVAIALVAPDVRGVAMAIMTMALLAASVGDILTFRLRIALIVVVALCSIFLAAHHGVYDLIVGLVAAALWLGLLAGVAFLFKLKRKRTGLGWGDIWLFVALAIWLGVASNWMVAIAALGGTGIAVLAGRTRKLTPTGPVIAAAGFIVGLLLEAGIWQRL